MYLLKSKKAIISLSVTFMILIALFCSYHFNIIHKKLNSSMITTQKLNYVMLLKGINPYDITDFEFMGYNDDSELVRFSRFKFKYNHTTYIVVFSHNTNQKFEAILKDDGKLLWGAVDSEMEVVELLQDSCKVH